MAEVSSWESKFVRRLINREKRDRYLFLLKGTKNRRKLTDRLNHALDYDPKWAGAWFDRHELRLEHAVDEVLCSAWGVVMICPPEPLAVYKPEDPGDLILLRRPAR